MLLIQLGQHIEVLPKEQDMNGKTIDTMTERIKTLIALVCLKILKMLVMNQFSFSMYVPITQLDVIHQMINGNKFLKLFNKKGILLLLIVLIKVLLVVIWREMHIHLDFSLNIMIESVFSNHLLKTLVFMEKELDVSQSLQQVLMKLLKFNQE